MTETTQSTQVSAHSSSHQEFSKISPTAKLVAYFREFSDIPYAKEISELIGAKSMTEEFCPDPETREMFHNFGAAGLEARYKCMISAVKSLGINQVLELASGLSFRGLVMTENPRVTYVETDLSPLMQEKMSIINQIPAMRSAANRPNIFFEAVNALSMPDLERALRHFDPHKPVAIIHEGLYMYLSRAEKATLASNIKKILERFGGAWITPDFMIDSESAKLLEHPKAQKLMETMTSTIAQLTGRNLGEQQFKDQADLSSFLGKQGFNMTARHQIDGSYDLTSLKKFPLPQSHFERMRDNLLVWVLTAKEK